MLFKLITALYHTSLATALRESEVIFPIVQVIHVVGLVVMIGPVVLVDLRLLGVLLRQQPAATLCTPLLKISWVGFGVLLLSGSLLFAAQSAAIYGNTFLRLKFLLLIVAGLNVAVFHLTTYRRVTEWGAAAVTPPQAKCAAALSLLVWVGVMSASHFIPYFGAL